MVIKLISKLDHKHSYSIKMLLSSFTAKEIENKIIILIIDSNKTSMQAEPEKQVL